MGDYSEAFVALDTSKLRNAVAIAETGRSGEVRFLGEIENTAAATGKLVRKLAGKYDRLAFCYEAGPTGYGLYRQITELGHECLVAAPALIPKKAGDRVKTTEDFITGIASKSYLSGKPYLVKFADGHTQPTGEWLKAHLAEVRKKKQDDQAPSAATDRGK